MDPSSQPASVSSGDSHTVGLGGSNASEEGQEETPPTQEMRYVGWRGGGGDHKVGCRDWREGVGRGGLEAGEGVERGRFVGEGSIRGGGTNGRGIFV